MSNRVSRFVCFPEGMTLVCKKCTLIMLSGALSFLCDLCRWTTFHTCYHVLLLFLFSAFFGIPSFDDRLSISTEKDRKKKRIIQIKKLFPRELCKPCPCHVLAFASSNVPSYCHSFSLILFMPEKNVSGCRETTCLFTVLFILLILPGKRHICGKPQINEQAWTGKPGSDIPRQKQRRRVCQ